MNDEDLPARLEDPARRLTASDRQEAAIGIVQFERHCAASGNWRLTPQRQRTWRGR
jgi:hypothetical protein